MQKLIMLRGTHTQNTRRSVNQAGAAAVSAVVSKTKKSTNLSPVSQGGTRTYWNETKYRKDIKLIPQRYRKSYEMITKSCMPTNWTV